MTASLGFNLLDWAILAILVLGFLRGFRQGFIRLLFGVAGFALGFLGAVKWATSLVHLSEKWFRLVSTTMGFIKGRISIPAEVALLPLRSLDTADIIRRLLRLPLSPELKDSVSQYLASLLFDMDTVANSAAGDFLYRAIASLLVHALAFVLVLWLIRTITAVVADILVQAMASHGSRALTDRLFGGALGSVQTAALLAAMVGLLNPVAGLAGNRLFGDLFLSSKIAPTLSGLYMWAINLVKGGL